MQDLTEESNLLRPTFATSMQSFEVADAYDEICNWRRNIFPFPKGAACKKFVKEMKHLIIAWNTKSGIQNTTFIKSLMTLSSLLTSS